MDYKNTLASYYSLSKPGIIYSNLLTALAGYLFASHWHNDYRNLITMLIGLGLIIGCGCVVNNIIDRQLDTNMQRTKKRALVAGDISVKNASIYAITLGLLGSLILLIYNDRLALFTALFGLFAYIVLYGLAKRKTVYGTAVGAISGAIPPLVGYYSVTDRVDLASLFIFLILVCWQLAHFYAIALYRQDDYAAAKIPIWPIIKGEKSTKVQILVFIVLFFVFSASLFVMGDCGYIYLAIVTLMSLWWFTKALRSLHKLKTKDWGKKVFFNSLTIIMLLSLALAIGPITP